MKTSESPPCIVLVRPTARAKKPYWPVVGATTTYDWMSIQWNLELAETTGNGIEGRSVGVDFTALILDGARYAGEVMRDWRASEGSRGWEFMLLSVRLMQLTSKPKKGKRR